MVEALKPALKNRKRAEQILEKFWTDKMALVWDTEDVHRAANERELALTEAQAITVLHLMHEYHNKQYGLQWSDLTPYVEENVAGRKLTKAELNGFVEKDILTMDLPHRKRRKHR